MNLIVDGGRLMTKCEDMMWKEWKQAYACKIVELRVMQLISYYDLA